MDTIFLNSQNSEISEPHRLLMSFLDKINQETSYKYVALSNLSIYSTLKNIKKLYKNNKFKISAPTWNEELELPDASYSASDIQDYFEYIKKTKHETVTDNPLIKIYANKIENRIKFKIRTGYYLELFTPETMKFLGSSKRKITKSENGENMSHL